MLVHKTELRVRYADTDKMQFVYNGKYYEYFEVGRTELLRDYGMTYDSIEKAGYYMPVVEAFIKYKNAAFYDELLVIETRMEKLPALRVRLDTKIFSKERGVQIVEGHIDLVFVNAETGKAVRPPEFFNESFKKFYDAV